MKPEITNEPCTCRGAKLTPEMERLFRDPVWVGTEHGPQIAVLLAEIDALRESLVIAERGRNDLVRAAEEHGARWCAALAAVREKLAAAEAQIRCEKEATAQMVAKLEAAASALDAAQTLSGRWQRMNEIIADAYDEQVARADDAQRAADLLAAKLMACPP